MAFIKVVKKHRANRESHKRRAHLSLDLYKAMFYVLATQHTISIPRTNTRVPNCVPSTHATNEVAKYVRCSFAWLESYFNVGAARILIIYDLGFTHCGAFPFGRMNDLRDDSFSRKGKCDSFSLCCQWFIYLKLRSF